MKRRLLLLFFAMLFTFQAVGCHFLVNKRHVLCREAVLKMTSSEIGLPAGEIYSFDKAEGESGYVSSSLLASLYGEGSVPDGCLPWLDYAIFLSRAKHPCEICVVLCSSPQNAKDTSQMMLKRLDRLRGEYGKEYPLYFEKASVYIHKNYVIFAVSSDPGNAYKAAISVLP